MQSGEAYLALGVLGVLYLVTLGWVIVQQRSLGRSLQERREVEAELRKQARIDFLTGLYNRQGFQESFDREVARARRYDRSLAVLMLDLDHLKEINDRYGHESGDEALRALTAVLRLSLRVTDIAARYGGDEFVILLPETDLEGAEAVAAKIRQAIADFNESGRLPYPLSASLGISADGDFDDMLRRADQAMYAEKFGRSKSRPLPVG